ncbi:serine protease DegQ [Aliiruegeria haliotis]|uniref:Serine protease DegQ n=1 Tax=Aliiruegeria haliotis TaxID=1280846 RepID=A0A2T0RMU7_9RHOB|nr:DegQ family serine endoprotease [Aliiruegeria haliotis]PRY22526.1 serine protease DegQ [Aliiruegeria haliotis]
MLKRLFVAILVLIAIAPVPSRAQAPDFDPERGLPTIAPLIAKVSEAVVNISVVSETPTQLTPLFRDPFFAPFQFPQDPRPNQRQVSAGSGVIVEADRGYVLTNNHVIENATEIRVTLTDQRSFEAEVVGSDPATDIALLKIDADDLTAVPFGDPDTLMVGDYVVAIGNPFGLGQTVTSGIISALGRSGINPEGYEDFIQTDASINPGNSGGALITFDGRLVGINTAIISPGGGNVGIGFAVPVDMARAVMDQLIRFGEVRRGRLGVTIQDLTPDLAEALGVDARSGAIVASVEDKSAADRAGLEPGDVITAVNGDPVTGSSELRQAIGMLRPDTEVEIEALRQGQRLALTTKLGDGSPARTARAGTPDLLAGVQLAPLGAAQRREGIDTGVVVTDIQPGTRAARAGLRPGDVILSINNTPVDNTGDVDRVLGATPSALALSVWREGERLLILLRS